MSMYCLHCCDLKCVSCSCWIWWQLPHQKGQSSIHDKSNARVCEKKPNTPCRPKGRERAANITRHTLSVIQHYQADFEPDFATSPGILWTISDTPATRSISTLPSQRDPSSAWHRSCPSASHPETSHHPFGATTAKRASISSASTIPRSRAASWWARSEPSSPVLLPVRRTRSVRSESRTWWTSPRCHRLPTRHSRGTLTMQRGYSPMVSGPSRRRRNNRRRPLVSPTNGRCWSVTRSRSGITRTSILWFVVTNYNLHSNRILLVMYTSNPRWEIEMATQKWACTEIRQIVLIGFKKHTRSPIMAS